MGYYTVALEEQSTYFLLVLAVLDYVIKSSHLLYVL